MIEFEYNKRVDERCWKRIIQAKEMFGHKFPDSFNITQKDIDSAKKQAKYFRRVWKENERDFYKGIKKIYGYSFPKKIICYINTSPYSMDDYENGYISISMHRDTPEKIVTTIIHEASHFMFRKYYTDFCRNIGCGQNDIENIKEIITIINNVEFKNVNDYGWKAHQKMRKKTEKIWQAIHDIKKVIKEIKSNLL